MHRMSTATHLATLEDIQDSLKWLRESIAGLPPEGLNWAPAAGTNSIAVLVRHALPSTAFWGAAGGGRTPSHRTYVEDERTPAFLAAAETEESLRALIDRVERELDAVLRHGKDEHLDVQVLMDDEPDEPPVSGAYCLVHAASHLREHAGQVALTRDLWLARAGE
jgi:hypothetical protein